MFYFVGLFTVSIFFFEETVSVRNVSEGSGVTEETVSAAMVSAVILSVAKGPSVLGSFLQLRTIIPISKVGMINFIIVNFVVMFQK